MITQSGLALMEVMGQGRLKKWYERFLPEESVTYPIMRGRLPGLLAKAMSDLDENIN